MQEIRITHLRYRAFWLWRKDMTVDMSSFIAGFHEQRAHHDHDELEKRSM